MKNYNFKGLGYKYVLAINRLMGKAFTKTERETEVAFILDDGREFVRLIDDKEFLKVVFCVPVPSLHKKNRIEKIGPKQWQFKGNKIEEVYTLIELALDANGIPHDFQLNKVESVPN